MRAFEAVARTGSVIEAARYLQMSQPSVSTQVRAVETQARSQLFLREGKSFSLTPLGSEVFQKVRVALSLVEDVAQLLSDQSTLERGILRVGYTAHQFSMPILSPFAARYPGIKLEARCMASGDLMERIDNNLMDVAMITASQAPEGYFARRLLQDRVVLMVPSGHELAAYRDSGVGWDLVKGHSIVRREISSGTRIIFEEAAMAQGLRLRSMLEVGSWSSMAEAVGAGIGIGIALEGELDERDDLIGVPVNDPALAAGHYLLTPLKMESVAAIDAFFELALGPGYKDKSDPSS
ncbi:MAG: LysR family transcriptional regulator [Mangrovicoccus sp.]|nr:LysR family transcriptional regulator [Mangrovicoccus sp.]